MFFIYLFLYLFLNSLVLFCFYILLGCNIWYQVPVIISGICFLLVIAFLPFIYFSTRFLFSYFVHDFLLTFMAGTNVQSRYQKIWALAFQSGTCSILATNIHFGYQKCWMLAYQSGTCFLLVTDVLQGPV